MSPPIASSDAIYIQLADYDRHGRPSTPATATSWQTSPRIFSRRRAAVLALSAVSLISLFAFIRRSLSDVDTTQYPFIIDPSVDLQSYLPLRVPEPRPARSPSLLPVHDLPPDCIDDYFTSGEPCHDPDVPKMDVVWTWVNGSDPLLEQAKESAQEALNAADDPYRPQRSNFQARMYRDHDELRHSIRSVLANFRPHARRLRLLAADFPVPDDIPVINLSVATDWRLGQVPQWLDLAKHTARGWRDGQVMLEVDHHSQFFDPYIGTGFNSYAIESQIHRLEGLSENFVYMNDDFFMTNSLTPTSFYTSAYGLVLRMQSNLMVSSDRPAPKTQGEWRAMGESNHLLSKRFGLRHRPYVVHEAKAASHALLHEIAQVWPAAHAAAAEHPFRETAAGDGDVNAMFMLNHFVVERAREAMLWAWAVGRMGGLDDRWDAKTGARAWAELGGKEGEQEMLIIAGRRRTLEKERVAERLRESGHRDASKTTYLFSSLDGYPYSALSTRGKDRWPNFDPDNRLDITPRCKIRYDECFAHELIPAARDGSLRASEVFKHIAFRRPECGDCVITALVNASGELGLSALLPPPGRVLPSLAGKLPDDASAGAVAHLPITDDWQAAEFSLRDVMGDARATDVRAWALHLLQRYRYVIGDTPSMFERLMSPRQVMAVLQRVDKNKDVALLCLNDDIDSGEAQVATYLHDWEEKKWGKPSAWERDS